MEIKPYIRTANYYETDQMGIIHHSNYIRWFEEARVDFMRQAGFGYREAVDSGIDFGLLSLTCEYIGMVRFGDEVSIQARICEMTPSRMAVRYTVRNADTGELVTTGETRHFYFDNRRRRPVSLKKALPQLYQLFCGLCVPDEEEATAKRRKR